MYVIILDTGKTSIFRAGLYWQNSKENTVSSSLRLPRAAMPSALKVLWRPKVALVSASSYFQQNSISFSS